MSTDVSQMAPPPGGLSKKTLLIGAAVLGGAVGLVFLMTRKMGGADPAEGTDPHALDANGVQIAHLANQLLGFRGDTSVAMAKQQDVLSGITDAIASLSGAQATAFETQNAAIESGFTAQSNTNSAAFSSIAEKFAALFSQYGAIQQQYGQISSQYGAISNQYSTLSASELGHYNDLLQQFASASASRQASDSAIQHQFAWLNFSRQFEAMQHSIEQAILQTDDPGAQRMYGQQINRLTQYQRAAAELQGFNAAGTYQAVHGAPLPTLAQLSNSYNTFVTQGTTDIYGNPVNTGAGGSSFRDILWHTFDNSQGDYEAGLAAVAAGPVRFTHKAG